MYTFTNEAEDLSNKVSLDDVTKTADISRKTFADFKGVFGTGITLTNNETKDIMKVITSLENKGILLKGTTRKITTQKGRFQNFLKPLMTASLPLMKNVLTAASGTDAAIQKKLYGSGTTASILSNKERYENS